VTGSSKRGVGGGATYLPLLQRRTGLLFPLTLLLLLVHADGGRALLRSVGAGRRGVGARGREDEGRGTDVATAAESPLSRMNIGTISQRNIPHHSPSGLRVPKVAGDGLRPRGLGRREGFLRGEKEE
jgi:hypothetical protein